MTLYVLAGIFAVLGIVCILLPFHVAMTRLCFLALGAVCLALRLLRGKKHERTGRMILLTLTGVCMLTVFGAMMYIDREGRSNVPEEADAPEFVVVLGAQVQGDQPSLTLKKRLDLALEYLTGHPQASVVVSGGQGADEPQAQKQTATAALGTIEKTVFGAGEVQPDSQPGVYAQTDGKIAEYLVEVGDSVKAGDVVARLENDELDAEIAQFEYDLQTAQQAVRATQTHTQYVYKQLYDDEGYPRFDTETGEPLLGQYSNEITIRAPADGLIKAVYIEKGDDALAVYREYGAVMLLSTDGKMKVELSGLSGSLLELGQTVAIRGKGLETTGKVVSLTRRGTEATVEVASDEYDMDVPVTVYTQAGETVGEGTLEINKPMAVSAYGGTIKGLLVKVGDRCERYDALARIEWDEIPLYLDNASVLRDYDKALVSLEAAYRKRDALAVTAPCDGVVATLDASRGDSVTDGTKLMSVVEADAGLTLTLAVDELDIRSVQPGQRVALSVDALSDAALTGVVQKIAPLGDASSGVTTYDVTVTVSGEDERVKGGMNVSGEIIVNAEDDAILIPTDALQKDDAGYCVTLESGETRRVTLGVMTDETTQILDGIGVGERVVY